MNCCPSPNTWTPTSYLILAQQRSLNEKNCVGIFHIWLSCGDPAKILMKIVEFKYFIHLENRLKAQMHLQVLEAAVAIAAGDAGERARDHAHSAQLAGEGEAGRLGHLGTGVLVIFKI